MIYIYIFIYIFLEALVNSRNAACASDHRSQHPLQWPPSRQFFSFCFFTLGSGDKSRVGIARVTLHSHVH